SAGICRSAESLEKAIAQVEVWRREFATLSLSQELINLTPEKIIGFDFPDAERQLRIWG
ncbi:MAG TPA: L-aspartate oxidase, partial [Cyanobacteria bacterium UBA11148]|nr:L-aspartate oxidase [Cyanobacteria bacterium UBA11148]